MSEKFINALKQKVLHVACDLKGKFYVIGYGGMGMECTSPASKDSEIVILSLIKEGRLLQKESVRYSPELATDLKYYYYNDLG